ncbi:hypothetical protein [Metabacillus litoralis]|uniref:hypothetical protein n=1 Tax=Metabacillus litoralis TaxID=152268 RepID=UPI000EF5DD22|nr:hypothetical protein [Metabacillus litoralis]
MADRFEEIGVLVLRELGQEGLPGERCVSIQRESGQKRSSSRKMCPDTGGIGTEKVFRQKDVSRYRENRDRKDPPAERCVSIQGESGQKRSSSRKMCLDTGGIGTEKVLQQKDVSRYRGNRDRKGPPAGRCVSIQGESGQKRSSVRKMCPDTGGIGTEKVLQQKDVSRYRGNRDRKGPPSERCVPIQAESGQKRSFSRKMCLDTGGIGTEKVLQQEDVSRYRGNRDRKGLPSGRCVSIQGESGQKRSSVRKMCPDTGGIGTEKVLQQEDVSRYRGNRDRKGPPSGRCVSIQGESGQKRPSLGKMCLDTERIGTEKVLQQEDVSRYRENRDRKDPPAERCVSIQGESGQKGSSVRKKCLDTERIGTNP